MKNSFQKANSSTIAHIKSSIIEQEDHTFFCAIWIRTDNSESAKTITGPFFNAATAEKEMAQMIKDFKEVVKEEYPQIKIGDLVYE